MKIKSVYLESFGKFQDRRIIFQDGINVIYGDNESGKSTIHQFLGAIFYGFVKPNLKNTRYLDELHDYAPMARDLYKGRVTFEWNDTLYELERDFSAKTFLLFNVETHEDITKFITIRDKGLDAPGKYFFGVEYSAFSNLLYFTQNHRDFTTGDAEIMKTSIRNLVESHGNGYSLEGAIEYLERKRTEIGAKSNLDRTLGRLERKRREMEANRTLLENRLQDRTSGMMKYEELLKMMEETQRKLIATDTVIQRNVNAQLALLEKEKTRIEEHLLITSDRIQEIEKNAVEEPDFNLFDELNATQMRLREKETLVEHRLLDLKENIETIEAKKLSENPDPDLREFEEIEKKMKFEQSKNIRKSRRGLNLTFMGFGGVFSLASLFYYYFNRSLNAFIGLGIGFILMVIGLFVYNEDVEDTKDISDEYKRRLEEIYERHGVHDREAFLEIALEKKNSLLDYYSNIRYLEKLRSDYIEVSNVKRKIDDELEENLRDHQYLYEKYNVKDKEAMQERMNELRELPLLKKKKEALEAEQVYTNDFYNALKQSPENAASRMNSLLQTQDLLDEKKRLQKSLQEMEREAFELKGRIDSMKDEYEHFEALKSDLARVENEMDHQEKKLRQIDKSKKYLKEAASIVGSKASPLVEEQAGKFFSIMTSDKRRKIFISPSLDIYLDDGNHRTPLRQLSEGTKEQVYLSIRMALTDILTPNLPLFFDESFVHFDRNRVINTFALLETFSDSRQVIAFTSNRDEALTLAAKNAGVNLIELR